jgi:hypothetical protein
MEKTYNYSPPNPLKGEREEGDRGDTPMTPAEIPLHLFSFK